MADSIQLLPDNIANQIAAGEVIQRPASAVKELLENAVDAGANEIQLIIADAGKALIQVIDNGRGMSMSDARMCFERHATSKIASIEDLFKIRTMGFRGEALASVAAVAQVVLKTKRAEDTAGTCVTIENSRVLSQEPIALEGGTSIAMKNLFFNIPARRNFLKSNAAEMRHIVDEFIRVAMAFPELQFSLTHNNQQLFHLEKGSLKQRIIQILGSHYNAKLVSVQEKTDYLTIYGFVGKPETAKKTRGDQYFFVNNRFIKSPYLHHAVMNAFQEMIPSDSFPLFVLFIDLDPSQVDINVHPTKQEIKFEDEKIVYAFVQAAIKHALAQYSVTPTIEFDLDPTIQQLDAVNKPFTDAQQQAAARSDMFHQFTERYQAHTVTPRERFNASTSFGETAFVSLIDQLRTDESAGNFEQDFSIHAQQRMHLTLDDQTYLTQLHQTYILTPINGGFYLVHQQRAHERILYERYSNATQGAAMAMQSSMFPVTLTLATSDAILLELLIDDLKLLGYLIEPFGKDSFVIQGTPADIREGNEKNTIENLLEQYKHFSASLQFSNREKVIRSLAQQHAIKAGVKLELSEMQMIVQSLFECAQPNVTAGGYPTYVEFKKDYIERLFTK